MWLSSPFTPKPAAPCQRLSLICACYCGSLLRAGGINIHALLILRLPSAMKDLILPDYKITLEKFEEFKTGDRLNALIRNSDAHISSTDEAIIRDRLAGMTNGLNKLRETGERFSVVYNDLIKLHTSMARYKLAYEAALAPQKRLPPEILSEIFLFATDGKPASFPLQRDTIRLRLTQVCGRWRRLALNTTHLWSDVEIWNISSCLIGKVIQWLQRTKSSSLKFRIHGACYWEETFNQLIQPLSDRISVLDLCTIRADDMLQQFALHSKNLSKIRFLSINVGYLSKSQIAFNLNPLLPHISLHIIGAPLHKMAIKLPFQSLMHLHLHSQCPANIALRLLHDCHSLQECFLSLFKIEQDALRSIRQLRLKVLPHIRKLKIHFTSSDNYTAFLHPLIMPSLQSLLLTGCILTWNSDFIDILTRNAFHNLQVLYTGIPKSRIDKSWCPIRGLPMVECSRVLSHLPRLQHVHFPPECSLSDATLAEIGSGHLLPHLRRFHLHSANLDTALDVIMQRQAAGSSKATPIEMAVITCARKVHKRQRATITDLQLSGSTVDVTSSAKLRLNWVMALFPSLYVQEDTYVWNVNVLEG